MRESERFLHLSDLKEAILNCWDEMCNLEKLWWIDVARSEFLTAVKITLLLFWVTTPCGLIFSAEISC